MTRALLVLVVLAAVALGLLGMRRGWRGRAARQGDLPAPRSLPDRGAAPVRCGPLPGRYLATTTEGDWLDRVVVHGLGLRSRCVLTVRDDGVLLDREGAPGVFLPVTDLVGARLDHAIAGSAYEDGGLVVVLWRLGDRVLASGMRLSEPDRHPEVVAAVAALVGAPAEGAP